MDPKDWQKELRIETSTQGTMTKLALVAVVTGLTRNQCRKNHEFYNQIHLALLLYGFKRENQAVSEKSKCGLPKGDLY